jgi:hypothetical protein
MIIRDQLTHLVYKLISANNWVRVDVIVQLQLSSNHCGMLQVISQVTFLFSYFMVRIQLEALML